MRFMKIGLAVAALAVGIGSASAQTLSYSQAGALLAQSCGADIQRFCANVNLGDGALRSCLTAQGNNISAQCVADYRRVVASLTKRAAAQASVPRVCRNDVARRCQGMVAGDANFLRCLNASQRIVSAACNQAIIDAGWR